MSRKRQISDPPPPTQLEHEEDVDSSSSSGDALAPPTPPLQEEEHSEPDAPQFADPPVPDLAAFFAQHPYFSAAQQVKLCRGYAAFKASTVDTKGAEKKGRRWPWSRPPDEDHSSPAQSSAFVHPRRGEVLPEAAKRTKRYWEK